MDLGVIVLQILGGYVFIGILVGSINSLLFGAQLGFTAGRMIVSAVIAWPGWVLMGLALLIARLSGFHISSDKGEIILTTESGEEMMRLPLVDEHGKMSKS